jgi:NitT/TauT family transport system permease protein
MSKVAIIFGFVKWPILLNTICGVKNVDPLLIKSARSMGASHLGILRW